MFPCLELTTLGDNRRRGSVAPAHRLVDGLLLRRAELVTLRLERSVEAGAEFVVVVENGAAQCLLHPLCHLHQPLVALPCRGVQQLFAALGGHGLSGGWGFAVIAAVAVFAVVVFVLILAFQPRLDGQLALGELGIERLAVGGVDLGAQRLVTGGKTQGFDAFVRKLAFQSQRALDGDLPVAEVLGVEPFRLGGFLCLAEVEVDDALEVCVREFTVLLAEIAAQRLEPLRCVDQLHLATPRFGLLVGQHPDVGGDAGVVEDVQRQGDDGFEPVVFQYPTADIALSLPRIACEQCRAVVYQRNAAAKRRVVLHLLQLVHQEHELPIARSSDKLELRVTRVVNDETRIVKTFLATHSLQISLPTFAIRGVRDHEIEFF